MKIYINTVTRECFNESGDFFKSNMPQIPYLSEEKVQIILCTSTDGGNDAGASPENWTRDTSYANINGIGAIVTVDSDFIHKIKGSLSSQITSGQVTSVVTEIDGASIAKIPSSGVVRIFNSSGSYEALTYSSRNVNGNSVTFTTSGNLLNTYPEGSVIDCDQSPYCSAYLNTAESNIQQGEFVFSLSCYSDRLREEMEYSDVEKLSVKGIELLIYKTEDSQDQILNAFICDTFSIVGTIGNVGFEGELENPVKNQIASTINQLLASGFEVEEEAKENGDHQFRFRLVTAGGDWSPWVTIPKGEKGADGTNFSPDATGTISERNNYDDEIKGFSFLATDEGKIYIKNSASSADWSDGILFRGEKGADGVDSFVYVAYASDASGTAFSLIPSVDLRFRAELHTQTEIQSPTLSDFQNVPFVEIVPDTSEFVMKTQLNIKEL